MLMYSDNQDADTLDVINDPRCDDAGKTGAFWVMCAALKRFYGEHKRLPVNGTIPDMTSTPEYYIALQHIYRNKGLADIELIKGYISTILTERGVDQGFLTEHAEEIVRFCKNANTLQVVSPQSLEDELANFRGPEDWELEDDETPSLWYVLLRYIEEFRQEKGYYAGSADHNEDSSADNKAKTKAEFDWIKAKADAYVEKITPGKGWDEKYLHELLRYSDTKLHTVSSFLGGVASQEIIKLLIKQYTILDHTFVYDGIHGRTQVYGAA